MAGWSPFTVMTNIVRCFTEFAEFSETFRKNSIVNELFSIAVNELMQRNKFVSQVLVRCKRDPVPMSLQLFLVDRQCGSGLKRESGTHLYLFCIC